MKNIFTFLCLICAFLPLALHAQEKTAVISPEQPKPGEEITITYHADSETAALKNPSAVSAELLCFTPDDKPVLKEMPMTQKGKAWTVNAALDKTCVLFLLRFSAIIPPQTEQVDRNLKQLLFDKLQLETKIDVMEFNKQNTIKNRPDLEPNINKEINDERKKLEEVKKQIDLLSKSGEEVDDNHENCWMTMVTVRNGKPVKDALRMRALVLRSGDVYGFKHLRDADGAKKSLDAELKEFPDNVKAMNLRWAMMIREAKTDNAKKAILKEVNQQYAKFEKNLSIAGEFIGVYSQLDEKKKADEIRKKVIEKDPKGKIAKDARLAELYELGKAPEKKSETLSAIESFLRDFPGDAQAQNLLITLYAQNGDVEKAVGYLDMMKIHDGSQYNSLAWPLVEKGENLQKAVEWAKKGIDLLRNPDPKDKPAYLSMKAWKQNTDYALGMILDTYAYGLYKLERKDDAMAAYEEAVKKINAGDADMNERYIACLNDAGIFDKALAFGRECIVKAKSNDKLVESCKTAFTKRSGSENGFDAWLADAKKAAKEDVRLRLAKEMMEKPSVDFTLKQLGGSTVSLAALKGKVVVLDFWATWCGPCKASFPTLQKVYDKFRDNPNVMFLAADTWEQEKGDQLEKNVRKFIDDNKYTFPVVFDEGFVEKYGVTGIPTKFIIDKNGMIRFRAIGFGSAAEMEEELTAEIEMLL